MNIRKSFLFILCVVLFACVSARPGTGDQQVVPPVPQPAAPAGPPPRLEFNELAHNFHDVKPGSENVCDFLVKNTGAGVLEIKNVQATCGCTAVAPEKKLLQSGETSKIGVRLRTPMHAGPVDKKIIVTTNDPANLTVTLSLLANVVTDLTITPDYIHFDGVDREKALTAEVVLTPRVPTSFQITEIRSDSPFVTAAQTPGEGNIKLSVKVDASQIPAALGDYFNTSIHFKTSSETFPEVHVPVNIRFIPDFVCIPQRLQVFNVKPEVPVNRDVIIKMSKLTPFKITGVRSSNTYVTAQIVQNDSTANVVTVTITAKGDVPILQGILSIDVGNKSVAVPFRVTMENQANTGVPPAVPPSAAPLPR